ncbi:TPA: hypothetical protein OVG04_002645 [Staphylococcus aureus]|uniref:hypothetical protein n=1 Tax=Staphylococcus warneri TaxID=1292 RepID=UPI00214C93C3|nr:hypothetical protein [Staphylococcus warneri]MCR1798149.1 hypothetical protein [Staphylococcus warneri]HCU8763832.1 hypothetical protein [Staphylococcus aureus]
MLKVNESQFGGNYIEVNLAVHDYSNESINNNIEVLNEVLDFVQNDEALQQLRERKRNLILNELEGHIDNLEWNAKAMQTLKTKGENVLIDEYKITSVNLNGKITREYQSIIRLFNAKVEVDNTLMNLGFVNQY